MAWGKGDALGSANSNTSTTTLVITTTATAEVGNMIVVASAWDNTDTADTALSSHLKVTDSAGNIYTILGSVANAQGAAAGGAHIILAAAMVTTQLTSGGTITVTSDTGRVAKCAAAEEFTLATPAFMLADKNLALDDAADPSALSLPSAFTTLPSREYLEIYALAVEGPNSDTYTWDADQTTLTSDGSAGSMHLRWSYRIATLTSDTVDVSSDTADRDSVSLLVALAQYTPDTFPTTAIIDNFNRANENPLSDGGNWESTVGVTAFRLTSNAADSPTANTTAQSNRTTVFPDDQEAYVTLSQENTAVGAGQGVIINITDAGSTSWDGYMLRHRGSLLGSVHDQMTVRRFINNANTRDCLQWIGLGKTTGNRYGLRRYGNVLETWYLPNGGAWTFLGAMEAVGDLLGGKIGIYAIEGVSVGGTRLDDFGGGQARIRPASITATSDVTGAVAHAKVLVPGAISATSAMSAAVTRPTKAVVPAAINATSAMSATVILLRIVPSAITATSAVAGSVTGRKPVIPSAINATSRMRGDLVQIVDIVGTATGNGGELFTVLMAPNGTSETATLAANISDTATALTLTGAGSLPAAGGFCLTIDDETLYVSRLTSGSYRIRGRGIGNTMPDSHTAGATATWTDSYDMAIRAQHDILGEFTADIADTGSFLYPGWLIAFDSTEAYLGGDRYPMHVTQVIGVFEADTGIGGANKIDAAQPDKIYTPTGTSDDCPAALSNPARIQEDIITGDVAVVRYTNPEGAILTLGPRSTSLQAWFGLKRVDAANADVTFTDPTGTVIDGSVNGEWLDPLGPGIDPMTGDATAGDVAYTSVTLPGSDRTFTHGGTPSPPNFNDKGWPICALAVRQGHRRIPYWRSWDWHQFSYVYCGFGTDATYCQILVNRNGINNFISVPEVLLPGPQDIDGPDAVWDDGSYYFGASWYVAIFSNPYIVIGPVIGGTTVTPGDTSPVPGVTFPGGIPTFVIPPDRVEGGSGGGIRPPRGQKFKVQVV